MMKQVLYNLNGKRLHTPLSNMEMYYLRLLLHNYSSSEICAFLELSERHLKALKAVIMEKFGSRDWTQIISWSFELGLLKQNNYTEDIVKEEALKITDTIFINHVVSSSSSFFAPNNIKCLILDFNKSCQKKYFKQAKELPKLSDMLQKIIQLRLNGFQKNVIIKVLNITQGTYQDMQQQLLDHFSCNTMYNVMRKALKYGVIKNMTLGNDKQHANILNSTIAQIYILRFLKKKGNKMRKLSIYTVLLEFYNKQEYNILLQLNVNPMSQVKNACDSSTINLNYTQSA